MENSTRLWALAILLISLTAVTACGSSTSMEKKSGEKKLEKTTASIEKATFAGGCFWCMEPPFEKLSGIVEVVSGYTGGKTQNPTYEDVTTGHTGHLEAIQVTYDPAKVTFAELLDVFWRNIDPTDDGGQFVDRGSQYLTGVFYHNDEQKRLAEESKNQLAASGRFKKPIVTVIRPFESFYAAEDYHQDFYKKSQVRYKSYRMFSGRDPFIDRAWADSVKKFQKPADADLRKTLTPLQYEVTQKHGTEPAFRNEFWDDHREGIYVDVVTGEPLFSSRDKFDSGTGWPSFAKPLQPEAVVENKDSSYGMSRVEVLSKSGATHLGHLFPDGPAPAGTRYCINSASLRFIPKEDLEKQGYGELKKLFEK